MDNRTFFGGCCNITHTLEVPPMPELPMTVRIRHEVDCDWFARVAKPDTVTMSGEVATVIHNRGAVKRGG